MTTPFRQAVEQKSIVNPFPTSQAEIDKLFAGSQAAMDANIEAGFQNPFAHKPTMPHKSNMKPKKPLHARHPEHHRLHVVHVSKPKPLYPGQFEILKKVDPAAAMSKKIHGKIRHQDQPLVTDEGVRTVWQLIDDILYKGAVQIGEIVGVIIDGLGRFTLEVTEGLVEKLREADRAFTEMRHRSQADLDRWLFEHGFVITVGGWFAGVLVVALLV